MSTRWAGFGFPLYKLLKSKIAEQRVTFFCYWWFHYLAAMDVDSSTSVSCPGRMQSQGQHLQGPACRGSVASSELMHQGWSSKETPPSVCSAATGVASDTAAAASQPDKQTQRQVTIESGCKCNHLLGFFSFSVIMSWFIKQPLLKLPNNFPFPLLFP